MPQRTILCIHGLGASKASFAALEQTPLARSSRIVAMDLPGFGDRLADPVHDRPITDAAEALAAEVERLGCETVILVGHSLGGAIVLLAARLVGDRVLGVVSIEGNLIAEDCGLSRRLANAASLAECAALKSKVIYETERSGNPALRDWIRDVSKVSPATLSAYSKQLVDLSDSGELLRQFHEARYRRLYLHGEDYVGHPVLQRLSPIQVEYIKGASHGNFMGDAPHACSAAISAVSS